MLFLQVNTLKSALEGVEKERDYYFSKLREVELLCQEQGEENAPFVDRLMEILYASDEQVGPQVERNCFSRWWWLGGCPSLWLNHVWSDQRKTSVFMLSHMTVHIWYPGRSRAGRGQRRGSGAADPGGGRRWPAGGAGWILTAILNTWEPSKDFNFFFFPCGSLFSLRLSTQSKLK